MSSGCINSASFSPAMFPPFRPTNSFSSPRLACTTRVSGSSTSTHSIDSLTISPSRYTDSGMWLAPLFPRFCGCLISSYRIPCRSAIASSYRSMSVRLVRRLPLEDGAGCLVRGTRGSSLSSSSLVRSLSAIFPSLSFSRSASVECRASRLFLVLQDRDAEAGAWRGMQCLRLTCMLLLSNSKSMGSSRLIGPQSRSSSEHDQITLVLVESHEQRLWRGFSAHG
mmetsp:Transcript_14584/g.33509  ORF Transcript_14584/g.33509 Transcript_14584/m.33509 type:complete len:224 (-) Transcript_14584:148-819(-)